MTENHLVALLAFALLGALLLLSAVIVWGIYREIASQKARSRFETRQTENLEFAKDVIGTLKDVHHTMDSVISGVQGSSELTKEKQNELLEVMRLQEGRIMKAIERLEQSLTITGLSKNPGIHIAGGQNVFGKNEGGATKS